MSEGYSNVYYVHETHEIRYKTTEITGITTGIMGITTGITGIVHENNGQIF